MRAALCLSRLDAAVRSERDWRRWLAAAAIQQCTLPKLNTSAGVRSVVPLDRFMGIFLQSWLAERSEVNPYADRGFIEL